jgi:hypothetical protein
MKVLVTVLVIVLFVGGYYAYQTPKIKALFVSSEKAEDPLDFLDDLPEVNPRPAPDKNPKKERKYYAGDYEPDFSDPETETEEVEPIQNQTSNQETSRILMQILKAKGLANGISIAAGDDKIMVFGTVKSERVRQEILDVIDKGRGARQIEAGELRVGN